MTIYFYELRVLSLTPTLVLYFLVLKHECETLQKVTHNNNHKTTGPPSTTLTPTQIPCKSKTTRVLCAEALPAKLRSTLDKNTVNIGEAFESGRNCCCFGYKNRPKVGFHPTGQVN